MPTPPKPAEPANPFHDKKQLLTEKVFLIGNGKSRENFDLERLRGKGTIIGCNALYREFEPDLLVAIDTKMLTELKKSGYCDTHECIAPNNRTVILPETMRWKPERFNTSGCFAIQMIGLLMKAKTCYMLGMDCYAGNVYDGTKNYNVNTQKNFSGTLNCYLDALNNDDIKTRFINVNEKDAWLPDTHKTGKYSFMLYDEFEQILAS